MEDWNDYTLILALHRTGTLRGAAQQLRTTHTTVARRLAALHKRRKGVVFEKQANGFRLTPFGEQLLSVATKVEQVVVASERLHLRIADDLSGPITLSLGEALSQYLLMQDLGRFTREYPNIQLTINSSSTIVDLDKAQADVVIRSAPKLPEHLVGRRLFAYSLCFYANADYLANTPIEQRVWIAPRSDEPWPSWLADSPFPHAPVGIRIDDIVTRFHAITQGLGMGRAACFMGDAHPDLLRLPNSKPVSQADIWVLTHPDLRHQPKVKLLMTFLADALHQKRHLIDVT